MSDIKNKTMLIQEVLTGRLEKYGWTNLIKLINDKYFYRAIYHLLIRSYTCKKSIPALSEILNPFKLSNQKNLKIIVIDTVNEKDELAAQGISLASTKSILNKKGISFLWAINTWKYKGRGIMDKSYKKYQEQGMLLLQLPLSRPIDKESTSKNIKLWNMVPRRMIRYISNMDENLIFIFFTNELNYLKDEINPNSRIYHFDYKKESVSLEVRRKVNAKNKKMFKEIDEHINKYYKTKMKW